MPSLVSSILTTMLNKKTACRALGTLAWLVLSSVPSPAMVGGALPADQTIARHVVLIIGGLSIAPLVAMNKLSTCFSTGNGAN